MSMKALPSAALVLLVMTTGCASQPPSHMYTVADSAKSSAGLILAVDEGERRVRRIKPQGVGLPGPFIIKVDPRNGGSQDLVMGYEEIAPGDSIHPHHHVIADEILFVHKGGGLVSLGSRRQQVGTGATVYIPRNTTISVLNNGTEPLAIVFVFSKPGFEQLMRENSVLEGQPVTTLSAEERKQIQARNRWHTVADGP